MATLPGPVFPLSLAPEALRPVYNGTRSEAQTGRKGRCNRVHGSRFTVRLESRAFIIAGCAWRPERTLHANEYLNAS